MTPIEHFKLINGKGFMVGCLTCNAKKGGIEKPLYYSSRQTNLEATVARVHANTHEAKHPRHAIIILEGELAS